MALTSKGRDVDLVRLPSGKFDLIFDTTTSGDRSNVGNPRFTDNCLHSVMSCVFTRKRGRRPGSKILEGGTYWDTSGRLGTLLWTVTHDVNSTRSQLVSAAEDAGQQLIDAKLITKLQADAQRIGTGLGRWFLTIQHVTPSSDPSNPERASVTI